MWRLCLNLDIYWLFKTKEKGRLCWVGLGYDVLGEARWCDHLLGPPLGCRRAGSSWPSLASSPVTDVLLQPMCPGRAFARLGRVGAQVVVVLWGLQPHGALQRGGLGHVDLAPEVLAACVRPTFHRVGYGRLACCCSWSRRPCPTRRCSCWSTSGRSVKATWIRRNIAASVPPS